MRAAALAETRYSCRADQPIGFVPISPSALAKDGTVHTYDPRPEGQMPGTAVRGIQL